MRHEGSPQTPPGGGGGARAAETKYAKSGDLHIAYQVVGDGPIDLVYIPFWLFSHVDYVWEGPAAARFLRRLSSFSRLIILDRRGAGLSDRTARLGTLEEQMDDLRAVLDAVGSEHAALFGWVDGAQLSAVFAATYPERTSALILYATGPKSSVSPDYPWGLTPETLHEFKKLAEEEWGTGFSLDMFGPSAAGDEGARNWWARLERLAVSRGGVRSLLQMLFEVDIRHVFPTIRVPTLLLRRTDDPLVPGESMRYAAERIPGSTYVEVPGIDNAVYFGDSGAVADEVQEFLTGVRQAPEPDRQLATVLFTDICGSTRLANEMGDGPWRALLDAHDALVERQLERFRGRMVRGTGDGVLATFDGPARAIRCAIGIREGLHGLGLDIRAGLHTGEVEVRGEEVGGIAVHIGEHVVDLARPGEVLVSGSVPPLVIGAGLEFTDRGSHPLKGVPGRWRLFAVES